ncbi:MAG: hypothetical protein KDD51_15310, partial [Bdellovibrionales bacterium]|nr:hypothetical protein [Bdellovibrionales bacterium]
YYKVKKNVRGRKRLNDQRWLHISSASGEFFPDYDRARFYGKVRSSIQDLEIDSERLEVAASEGKETLLAEGHVRVRSKGRVASAKRAALRLGSNQLVLEGDARVDAKEDRIEGKRIVLYTDDDRVEVTGAKGKIDGDS